MNARYSRGLVVAPESRGQPNPGRVLTPYLATLTLHNTHTGCAATAACATNVISDCRDKDEAGFGLSLRLHRRQQEVVARNTKRRYS
jgi:hypothetical protein